MILSYNIMPCKSTLTGDRAMNLVQERLNEIDKSQGWLAGRTGIARSYINKICKQKINSGEIRVRTAHAISKALNSTIEHLFPVDHNED